MVAVPLDRLTGYSAPSSFPLFSSETRTHAAGIPSWRLPVPGPQILRPRRVDFDPAIVLIVIIITIRAKSPSPVPLLYLCVLAMRPGSVIQMTL